LISAQERPSAQVRTRRRLDGRQHVDHLAFDIEAFPGRRHCSASPRVKGQVAVPATVSVASSAAYSSSGAAPAELVPVFSPVFAGVLSNAFVKPR
jgi:hypothetical protein